MILHKITDWDNAYANGAHIPGGNRWPAAWVGPAETFRMEMAGAGRARLDLPYGEGTRNRFDLFLPEGKPKGLVVFVHGGYWHLLDKSFWSHLAKGSVDSGFAVALPSYTLCPENRIAGITREIGAAITAAAGMVEGPLFLTGHSAGGHLVSRMNCADAPLEEGIRRRIRHTVSISGLHDLRPIMKTEMNEVLHLDAAEAESESPALLQPMAGARITCWVGAGERAEFLRQSALLANIWTGLGAETAAYAEPDRHHFNVIDGLTDADHPLTRTLIDA
ncbi:MAG: alpha/beta hydrolase [Rhizobiales bacterium 63-7]|uniref:alpha/beta hydrolase n=1 Tax=Rhizobium sp. YJ-22 TaxID=3037556 RepID=UPI00092979B4|nr:alpha/beta hydrolase [Rhizobium sp. YJ-22]MBN9031665.1 alpha/beta hydrolase [Hyphomicrobiales bacterium]MDG3575261.1 alpha/beta hydrolase [Rhizobium sp. YJ-22]OJU70340.1 MAG: alpha/beta hydrolase [Rhizobiales bacterium 63-7]